jgi:hypothetical protein
MVYVNDPAIVRALQEENANRDVGIGKVVGLYRFPSSKDVECPGWTCPHTTNKRYGYGRHPKFGHIVHGGCNKREHGFRDRLHRILLDTFGINLLPRDATPRIFRNPEGYDLQ